MFILKNQLFIKLLFSFYISVYGVHLTHSLEMEVGNTAPIPAGGMKRILSQQKELTPNDLVLKHPVIGERLSDYVQFYDLCAVELVCTTFAKKVRNSRQYQALIFDYKNNNGWQDIQAPTAKDKFISLRNSNNLNFITHVFLMWLNHLPFGLISSLEDKPPLSYYWEKQLTQKQSKLIQNFLHGTVALWDTTFTPKSSFYYNSIIGLIKTLMAMGSPQSLNHVRRRLNDIINTTDSNCLLETKLNAQLLLATSNVFGLDGPVNFEAARQGFQAVRDNNAALPHHRAAAQINLAGMDRWGQGGPVNFNAARQEFQAVRDNDAASPKDRATAQFRLAEMDLLGQGGPVNFDAARQGLQAVFDKDAIQPQNGYRTQQR